MAPKRAIYLLLVTLALRGSQCSTRYYVKMRTNASELFKTRGDNSRVLEQPIAATTSPLYDETRDHFQDDDQRMIKDFPRTDDESRNSFETSTFNPDVLNKFLEEYASKIKSSTEKYQKHPFRVVKPSEALALEVDVPTAQPTSSSSAQVTKPEEDGVNATLAEAGLSDSLNDTLKRNKYYGANSYEDRNGWVTLEAIPWSKSKISKWQATPSTQQPWPEVKPWEKPGMGKPWASDYSVRPIYENNKPWYEKPKPNWPENNEKPWQKPTTRPSYYPDKVDEGQAQKWPPERPSWNKYTDRPNSDIITDNRPANFPSSWNNRPQTAKPGYQYLDRFSDKNQAEENNNDWHDFPSRFDDRLRPSTDRPAFSQYQYVNNHPQSYPGNGDGQWVLLSTNRGYSKARQRSMKIDTTNPLQNGNKSIRVKGEEADPAIAVMTSKRQVRLTVLPSINGTNTTTSHGGLLEVEKTFKSVDQSQKEYEMKRQSLPVILKKRPIRNTLGNQASNSAVLAAVSAGILPATMAMMIPMILGRRKRDIKAPQSRLLNYDNSVMNIHDPTNQRGARETRLR
ncbi:uncharacterized protein LOC114872855 [Osmia bicornis bicornis]|uniref:uncharacterized protein LOC114872855 n=1 Tax=Osmia bicornis bicornis TaxID=1437191 RepID=UPI001EAF7AE4|nr:uncharacterized protein LOC114872855 [Osmia bicornis bicornis]XP_046142303.1 uncharacterized protein LOC114872855 [Osmia bicornis bicornis]